ncbi:MAG: AgmX/PglI C-terminal domain-containing protein [Myxococcota bacterium]
MKTNLLMLSCSTALLFACATPPDEGAGSETGDEIMAASVSTAALDIERAERILDRGGDEKEALKLATSALESAALTDGERVRGIIVQSRAHDTLGDREMAIAVVERALGEYRDELAKPLARRLRSIYDLSLGLPPVPANTQSAPFAELLAANFRPDPEGNYVLRLLIVGNAESGPDRWIGFDIGTAVRSLERKRCPLCPELEHVALSIAQNDWLSLVTDAPDLGRAAVVVAYDLERNRIPQRYESVLPMPVAEIESRLERGQSFILAEDRSPQPPVVLFAAPRTALLAEVKRAAADLTELPTELLPVDIPSTLRAEEIQATLRHDFFGPLKTCYEEELDRTPQIGGGLLLDFAIDSDGHTGPLTLENRSGDLLAREDFETCLRSAFAEVRFPAHASDEPTRVRYPVVLSP